MPILSSPLHRAALLLVAALLVTAGATMALGADVRGPSPELKIDAETRTAHEREAAAQRARREDPEEQAERRATRRAFAGKSDAQARQILHEHHGPLARAQPWRRPSMGEGERIVGWRDDATAVVAIDGKPGKGLLTSTLPLVATDRQGEKRMLDYTLLDSGGFLVPDNPLVDIRLPKRLQDGVRLGDIALHVATRGGSPEVQKAGDKGFWPNIDTDTDLVVMPLPAGVETFHHLRSEDSPEEIAVRFDLPPGARLSEAVQRAPDGLEGNFTWYEIRAGDDLIASVLPPAAWDADNHDVPLTASLRGDTLVLKVDHRGRDVRYPVIVDPYVDYHNWQAGQHWDRGTWNYVSSHEAGRIGAELLMDGGYNDPEDWPDRGPFGNGLYLFTYDGGDYHDWEYADWRTDSRGNASIYRMEIGNMYYRPARDASGYSMSYVEQGICRWACIDWQADYHHGPWFKATWESGMDPTGTSPSWDHYWPDFQWKTHCAMAQCSWEVEDKADNFAVFRLVLRPSGPLVKRAVAKFGIGHVAQWDLVDPLFGAAPEHNFDPDRWTSAGSVTTKIHGRDDGLGIESVALSHTDSEGDRQTKVAGTGCNRNVQNDRYTTNCPTDFDPAFEYDVPPGISWADAVVTDYASRRLASAPWRVKVDRKGPQIALSGALWDAQGKTVTVSAPLTVTATDGSDEDDSTKRSGVKRVELWVDDRRIEDEAAGSQTLSRSEPSCDSCSLSGTLDFDAADYPDDDHTVVVKAWDYAGHQASTEPFEVITDTRPPVLGVTSHLNRPAGWFDATVPSVELRGQDHGGGIASLRLESSLGWSLPREFGCTGTVAGRCDPTQRTDTLAYNEATSKLPEGIQSLTASAKDPAGHASTSAGRGLRADYFPSTDLTGVPLTRTDASIDFDWVNRAPHPNIPIDFSVRWSGKVIPRYSERYTFRARVDDKVRLIVDGQVLFNDANWSNEDSGTISLQAGRAYDIVLEAHDTGGDARAHLRWESPSQPLQIVPADRLTPPTTGLAAEFFDNKDHTGASYHRIGVAVDGAWSGAPDPRLDRDTWSARWVGKVVPRYTDDYTFWTRANDGVRVWVDGRQLIDDWAVRAQAADQTATQAVRLEGGKSYDVRLEFFDEAGDASVQLGWQSAQQAREVIPIDRLTPEGPTTGPWTAKVDKTPPSVSVSGPLAEVAGQYLEGPTPVDFLATDGSAESDATQRSGVKSWEIDAGTATIPGGDRTAVGDSQPWSGTATVTPSLSQYRDGRNDVAVAAMDRLHPQANHRGVSRRISVWADKTPPTLTVFGPLLQSAGTPLWEGAYSLGARATDGSYDDPRSGLRRTDYYLGRVNSDGSVPSEELAHRSEPRPGASSNLVPNASFERVPGQSGTPALSAWQGSFARTTDAASVEHGGFAGRLTPASTAIALAFVDQSRISVTPGEELALSAFLRANQAGVRGHFAPRWFDANGNKLGEGATDVIDVPTTRVRYTDTWTVPARAVSIGWRVGINAHPAGAHLDFDALQIERGAPATDFALRSTSNLFSNTSFERADNADGAPDFRATQGTFERVTDAAAVEHGAYAARLRPDSTADVQLVNDDEKVPVTPGERLNFSAYMRASQAGATVWVAPRWFDEQGGFIGQDGTARHTVGTTRKKYASAWTVPSNVRKIGWAVTMQSHTATTTLDIDAVQVEQGVDTSEYFPLTTRNLFNNTSFERPSGQDGAPALTPMGATWERVQDAPSAEHGRWAARLTPTTTSTARLVSDYERAPVRWGERVTFSAYARSSAARGTWSVSPRWRDANGVFLGDNVGPPQPLTTGRQRYTAVSTAPPGAASVGWVVGISGHALGQTLDVDAVQGERGDLPTAYREPRATASAHTGSWTFVPSQYEPGRYRLRVRTADILGLLRVHTLDMEVDSPPELEVEGGLRSSPLATGRNLTATATDAYNGIKDVRVYIRPTDQLEPGGADGEEVHSKTCVEPDPCREMATTFDLPDDYPTGRYQFTVRTKDKANHPAEERWVAEIVQTRSGESQKLGLEQWFELDDTDSGGDSTVYVNGETGNVVWHQVPIVNPGRGLSSVVNLTYNSHGRGGTLGVDATRLPVVGLNPDDDSVFGRDVSGLMYNQAGVGFSIAVGGPTRVNEPLGGALQAGVIERTLPSHDSPWPVAATRNQVLEDNGLALGDLVESRVTLTDADGTQHTYVRRSGETAWKSPPGVNLRLRYIGNRDGGLLGALTAIHLRADAAWELRRPDGVRFVFDSFGFQRRTVDRNDNELKYVYETYSATTGEPCDESDPVLRLHADAGLCLPRLKEVQQPTYASTDLPGNDEDERTRKIALVYGSETGTVVDLNAAFGVPPGTLLGATYATGGGPRLTSLRDAAGVEYRFDYYADGTALEGYLKEFTENAGDPDVADRRATRFRFCEGLADSDTCHEQLDNSESGDAHQLSSVVPIVDGVPTQGTRLTYDPRQDETVGPPKPRGAMGLRKRSDARRIYRYSPASATVKATFTAHEESLGTRYLTRETTLDSRGRPERVVERASDISDPNHPVPSVAAKHGSTTTELTWNDAENKVSRHVEAAGDGAQRTTDYTYVTDGTGELTSRTVTAGGVTRRWELTYHPDAADRFVADVHTIKQPGGREWVYGRDGRGNVISTKDPRQVVTETDYDDNNGFVVEGQTDENGKWTRFRDHDLGGNPQTVTLPRDDTAPTDPLATGARRYTYDYDARGDVLRVVDPRGNPAHAAHNASETSPYTTTLEYDAFGRLVREHIPRLSDGGATAADPAFVERLRRFNRDGGVTDVRDVHGRWTTIESDAMGHPLAVFAPGSKDGGRSRELGRDVYRTEVSRFVYDDAQRLIASVRPAGSDWPDVERTRADIRSEHIAACEQADAPQGDRPHATRYCLDHRGLPVAEVQYGTAADALARRLTTFRYDGRGNVRSVADANRNAEWVTYAAGPRQVTKAIADMLEPEELEARHRFSYTYDLLDRRTVETERPLAGDGAPTIRTFTYDEAGDLEKVVDEDGERDRVVKMGHDAMGRMLWRTDYPDGEGAAGRMTCVDRRADGLVVAVTTPRGTAGATPHDCEAPGHPWSAHTTRYTYDAVGDVVRRSIPYATAQYGPSRDEIDDWEVVYDRDAVGNARAITDAAGERIENQFYDGGELRSTTRPSFYDVQWPDAQANPRAGDRYAGSDAADVEVARGGPSVVEREGRSSNAERSGKLPDKPASLGKGDLGEVEPQALPGALPQAGLTRFRYDAAMQLTSVVDAADESRVIAYDPAQRVARKRWPRVFGGDGIEHEFEYDANGNLERVEEDWMGDVRATTLFAYDGYDRRVLENAPGAQSSASGELTRERTAFAYDANDNVVTRETPRGAETQTVGDFTFRFEHDSRDRLRWERNPAGERFDYAYTRFGEAEDVIAPHPAGARLPLYTTKATYDRVGQLTRQTRAVDIPGEADRELAWDYAYDADGNRNETKSPGAPDVVTTRVDHDGRNLPWRTTVTDGKTSDGVRRTTITEYDANGNVRRLVKPRGIDQSADGGRGLPRVADNGENDDANLAAASENATVFRYDEHDLLVEERLPWRGESDTKYARDFDRSRPGHHGQRWVTAITQPHPADENPTWQTLYDHNAAGWITEARENTRDRDLDSEPFEPTVRYAYDERGRQTLWRSLHAYVDDRGRDIRHSYWPNGLLRQRLAIKTVDRESGEDDPADTSRREYDYYYNPNRSLVRVTDRDFNRLQNGDQERTTVYRRDDAEREQYVDEEWEQGKDVELAYEDGTGRLRLRRTDGQLDGTSYGGAKAKTTTFSYDSLGRELQMVVDPPERDENRTTTTRWHDAGLMDWRRKPNGTVDEWDWNALREKTRHERRKQGEDVGHVDRYRYDTDGNRELDERGEHRFNARDHLTWWKRSDDRGRADRRGWTTEYTVDGSGKITDKVERTEGSDGAEGPIRVRHELEYNGERLTRVTVHDDTEPRPVHTIQTFAHDDAGNVQRVRTTFDIDGDAIVDEPPTGKTRLDPEECRAPDTTTTNVTRYCYDEFNRQVFSSGYGIAEPALITYDGLDRRDRKVVKDLTGNDAETRDYAYIGTSELLTNETVVTRDLVTKTERHTYDYDSQGDRQGQQVADDDGVRYKPYAKDANGSVVGLEDEQTGDVAPEDRYDYEPYGDLDREAPTGGTGDELEAGLSDDAKDNPFRFEGFYYDSGVKSYDMHARHYRPELASFLSRDQYASAAGDQALQADPLTQNRYAFAGGNPVNNVEFDGHVYKGGGGSGGPRTAEGRPTTVANAHPSPGSQVAIAPCKPAPAPPPPPPPKVDPFKAVINGAVKGVADAGKWTANAAVDTAEFGYDVGAEVVTGAVSGARSVYDWQRCQQQPEFAQDPDCGVGLEDVEDLAATAEYYTTGSTRELAVKWGAFPLTMLATRGVRGPPARNRGGSAATTVDPAGSGRRWTPTEVLGRRVYQRDDLFDPHLVTADGRTNLERMRDGNPPIGHDGQRVELHHSIQAEPGPMIEVTGTLHTRHRRTLHVNWPPSAFPGIHPSGSYTSFRKQYWPLRARDFE